jgi:predicted nucleotidyltransferase
LESRDALSTLPVTIRACLEAWQDDLKRILGDDLVALLVHGSVARGTYRPEESDIDALVVVKAAPLAQLEAIGNTIRVARFAARIESMILVERELAGASDVFPLLFDEIKAHHVLLSGRDLFSDVTVNDAHRRLRIEQELRDAHIRLRRGAAEAVGSPRALATLVARKAKQVRPALRALLARRGIKGGDDTSEVLSAAGQLLGVDTSALQTPGPPARAFDALQELLSRAVEHVDAEGTP